MGQTIYYNGDILTMEDHGNENPPEAVCISGGMICKTGTNEEVFALRNESTRMVDLKGKTLMPAFVDAHSHFAGYASSLLQVSLDEAVDFKEIQDKIRAFIKENKVQPGEWVTAKGYDHNRLKERRQPDRELLDKAAPENPVIIGHQSGHMGVVNSKAMELLHLDENTICPEGGKIETRDGLLTGYLEENAYIQAQQKVPMKSPEEFLRAFKQAQEAYAANGITTVQEGMLPDQMADMYKELVQSGILKVDVVGYADIRSCEKLFQVFPDHVKKYNRHFKISGYKIFLDGSPQGRTAWMLTPYKNSQGKYYGYPALSDEQVQEYIEKALREDMQILAHCNGDAASLQYLDSYGKVLAKTKNNGDIRPVIIHAQLLPPDQMDKVKDYGMIPSFFVAHVWYWGDIHIENFGLERAGRISAANSAGKRGIRYTFHQDAPVIQPNMLETVWCAVNRITKNGVLLGGEERITVEEALKAVTINGAYQYHEEDSKGSICEGKRADLVILDQNPMKADPMMLKDITVLETIKDGETIYQKSL